MRTHCGNCDTPLVETKTINRYRYCPNCSRRRSRERRKRFSSMQIDPVVVVGAREKLRAFINEQPDYAISAILNLVTERHVFEQAA